MPVTPYAEITNPWDLARDFVGPSKGHIEHDQMLVIDGRGRLTRVDTGMVWFLVPLWQLGFETRFSCEGKDPHPTRNPAYVSFPSNCNVDTLDALARECGYTPVRAVYEIVEGSHGQPVARCSDEHHRWATDELEVALWPDGTTVWYLHMIERNRFARRLRQIAADPLRHRGLTGPWREHLTPVVYDELTDQPAMWSTPQAAG